MTKERGLSWGFFVFLFLSLKQRGRSEYGKQLSTKQTEYLQDMDSPLNTAVVSESSLQRQSTNFTLFLSDTQAVELVQYIPDCSKVSRHTIVHLISPFLSDPPAFLAVIPCTQSQPNHKWFIPKFGKEWQASGFNTGAPPPSTLRLRPLAPQLKMSVKSPLLELKSQPFSS